MVGRKQMELIISRNQIDHHTLPILPTLLSLKIKGDTVSSSERYVAFRHVMAKLLSPTGRSQ